MALILQILVQQSLALIQVIFPGFVSKTKLFT